MVVTIKDVAKKANVAPSTVSRVIANSPRISEKTKKRVREVMEELGYYPNFQARSLAAKSTQSIGVIMPNSAYHAFQNPFFPEVLRGISKNAHANKYGIYLSTGSTSEEIYTEVASMVQGRRVDGVILLYSRINDKTMKFLQEMDFPFTVVGRPFQNEERITYVDNDNIFITKEVTNYLIDLGHRNIAFVGGSAEFVVTLDRLNGYKLALNEAGIRFNKEYMVHEEFIKDNGKEAIKSLMELESPPTALVTQDDLIAYEMISHLEDMKIRVPEDMSIVSFNNLMLSEHSKPPLTSVDICTYQLGFEATNCLIEKIEKPDTLPKRTTIPTKFIKRKSCERKL
ncbi:LacI family DNA-binding transcriptional regulator [Metabacillus malikii]|uniref:DNA-binding LacI/PurR family transcriptional regulator n=1 Tax=Metabacillus malikii TaxID=1504265 RepID=A0ABT9ZFU9_9BACI|nr:LacI family DNA-binding transcriptional regulator [Metabacillus malikii]MDQ0230764.1 DNA-binding LacI/PurR family transcriptional regulator [Metabacillus malikii]